MKVYLRTANTNKSTINTIESVLKSAKHKVDISIVKVENKDSYSSKDTDQLAKYDLLIIEATVANAQLGFETSFASEKNVPVIVLYNDETGTRGLFPLTALNPNTKLIIKGYKMKELESDVKNVIKEIEDYLNSRFTLSFTPQISDFLKWITDHNKITRSDFIRSLIENALKKNTDYKAYLKNRP